MTKEPLTAPSEAPESDRRARPSERDPLIGQILDSKYEIMEQIGGGGMGVVYLASHREIERKVAVKVLRSDLFDSTEPAELFLARFLREAKSASSILHPNVVEVFDYGEFQGFPYLVLEFVEGQTLKTRLRENSALPISEVIDIATQIASALSAAHAKNIVHRDLKPQNIILHRFQNGDLNVKVVDFGLAKSWSESASPDDAVTRLGTMVGTPHYMSPEQVNGHAVDGRTDLYALGVVIYEMLTGVTPFNSDSAVSILMKHITEEHRPLREIKPELQLPEELEQVINRCLEKSLDKRIASATELLAALGELNSSASQTRERSRSKFDKQLRFVVAVILAVSFLGLSLIYLQSYNRSNKEVDPTSIDSADGDEIRTWTVPTK